MRRGPLLAWSVWRCSAEHPGSGARDRLALDTGHERHTASCTDAEGLWSEACREATAAFIACEIRLSCDELRSRLGTQDHRSTDPCEAERQASEACRPAPEPFIDFQF